MRVSRRMDNESIGDAGRFLRDKAIEWVGKVGQVGLYYQQFQRNRNQSSFDIDLGIGLDHSMVRSTQRNRRARRSDASQENTVRVQIPQTELNDVGRFTDTCEMRSSETIFVSVTSNRAIEVT